ncbi:MULTISPECIES: aldehyde oxidoreductase molybdenum-binding subunit PaoC [unclassified Sphingomonas]|uniref:aldehyde oxidoreductase molybdenum-binding subunit PaoC n=1 Tax=unclassified Sphingomonas TaxID=196159 RepID=UPI00104DA4A5|nr:MULTISPECIES: aldehyde oxidoreductase molybdenum-binding subunit PaoC [unclassified Sphingomonas]TCP96149.1 xanthine dehydrogenase molybdenum binding subunit apoprotein [Sphingomonas sp. PP-F2F-A104-K0414]TCQ06491.1 xanthine dehydrogenase YagR molybdenum-binding subunit [Sphingomonas sp. PP-CC-3A-396]
MKFETPATTNPIDRMKVVGRAQTRIDGPLKTTGLAPYAYERHREIENAAYGYVVGAAVAKGRINAVDTAAAKAAPGVIAIVTAADVGKLGKGKFNTVKLLAGPDVDHYHQAVAVVVAETFEQARAAAGLVRVDYARGKGRFDLDAALKTAPLTDAEKPGKGEDRVGKFETAFASAPVKLDAEYTTPDHSHAMMEPFASIAAWNGDALTVWTSNQMIDWGRTDLATTLNMPKEKVTFLSPYVGGGFGGKLFLRSDAVLAALGAKAAGRPVKLAMSRPFMANNTTHRPATRQRIRIGATKDGTITAIAHESGSGDQPNGSPEAAVLQTNLLYAGANRLTSMRLAVLDLPEGNAMRAPGEAPGLMALEVAMDEMAEKLRMDPIAFRVKNDTQVDPKDPKRRFSQRQLVRCLTEGAQQFGWSRRNAQPGQVRDGRWLVGMGVASAFRNHMNMTSGARVRLGKDGIVTVETDMTDIGTGSYTIIAQTAAEMMGVPLDTVVVRLGSSAFPVSAGSGGQFGAANSTAGVYAACVKLREAVAQRLGYNSADVVFDSGKVTSGNRSADLRQAASAGELVAEDKIEYGTLDKSWQISTFGAHFVEVGVDTYTGATRLRRMLAVCAAGRIINPTSARSQVIGAMTMGVGSALMEELAVDKRFGFFVNHDLASYEVPVHADIPHQEVIFLDEADDKANPMKAKGIGELGLCGVGAAVANAMYNATGVRLRDYPLTLDKHLDRLPTVA